MKCLFVFFLQFWIFLFVLFFCMSHHIFVLPNQNSDSAGHMTFEKEKIICSPVHLTYWIL